MTTSPNFVITLICHPDQAFLTSTWMQDVAESVGSGTVNCLAENIAYDIIPDPSKDQQALAKILENRLGGHNIDYTIIPAANRRKRLLIADMDSTMIDQECIDELADYAGFKKEVSKITARAMNGEIEFGSALKERVLLLKDLHLSVIDKVIEERITLASGGRTLLKTMKSNGAYCALVSGGFTQFTSRIGSMLGFDEDRANQLLATENKLNGKVAEPILGSDAKVTALEEIAEKLGITTLDAIAVGDGANDLPMLKKAGLGVALHAKPSVAAAAKINIDHSDLTSLLYIQGYSNSEVLHG